MAKNFPQKCGKIAYNRPSQKRSDSIGNGSLNHRNIIIILNYYFLTNCISIMTVLVSRNTVLVKYFLIYKIIRPFHSKIGASQHPLHLHIAP